MKEKREQQPLASSWQHASSQEVDTMERRIRTLSKTLSWRIVATSTTMVLVFLLTGNLALSATVGSLETLVKTIVYYLHERVWNASSFGRENCGGQPLSIERKQPEESSQSSRCIQENDEEL